MKNKEYYQTLYPAGTRVRIISLCNKEKNYPNGSLGTVTFIDDIPQIHVAWDNAGSIALIPEQDKFEIIDSKLDKYLQSLKTACNQLGLRFKTKDYNEYIICGNEINDCFAIKGSTPEDLANQIESFIDSYEFQDNKVSFENKLNCLYCESIKHLF